MKALLTISTLVFTVMFSSTSFAGWTKLGKNSSGDKYIGDFNDGFDGEGIYIYADGRVLEGT